MRYLSTIALALAGNARSPRFLVQAAVLLPRMVHAARLMELEGVEHLHVHYATHPGLAAWVVHRLTGIPYSITTHMHDIFVDRTMLGTKLRHAAFAVTISDYNHRFLAERVGRWTLDRVRVIRCGVREPRKRLRAVSRTPGHTFEIACVGSLERRKGHHVLLEAVALLAADRIDVRCRIVGDGPERHALQAAIDARQLSAVVELLGPRTEPEVERVLAAAHCYVQPSIWDRARGEGLPVALMEAMAAALPVVASSIAGIPELVSHKATGWLVPPGDATALAGAIREVFDDPQQAAIVAARGHEHVCDAYALEANVAAFAGLLSRSPAIAGREEVPERA